MHENDPPSWPGHFIQEMKLARLAAGFTSQRELGDAIGWSRSRIADIESGRELPPLEMVKVLDAKLGTRELLSRIWALAKRADVSRWIAEYFEIEEKAERIRQFQPILPIGLIQTRETAKAILSTSRYSPGLNGVSVEERVEQRMHRQRILTNGSLKSLWVVLDESVLRRAIGAPDVMKAQMQHYLDLMETGMVGIQVLPYSSGAAAAQLAFALLDVPQLGTFAHMDGPVKGTTTSDPRTVAGCEAVFDGLRSEALSLRDSAAMIQARMEEL